jgi:uncharacterized RDD family membrane protein YckC
MSTLHRNAWVARHGKPVALLMALVWLLAAYGFATLAIDRGEVWAYLASTFFLVRGVYYIIFFAKATIGGKRQATKA